MNCPVLSSSLSLLLSLRPMASLERNPLWPCFRMVRGAGEGGGRSGGYLCAPVPHPHKCVNTEAPLGRPLYDRDGWTSKRDLTFETLSLLALWWRWLYLLGSRSSRNKTDLLPKPPLLNHGWVLTWLNAVKSSFNSICYYTAMKHWARIGTRQLAFRSALLVSVKSWRLRWGKTITVHSLPTRVRELLAAREDGSLLC